MSGVDQNQGGQAQGQNQGQQPTNVFIKPEQIIAQNFPFFNAETLAKYQNGFKHLWQTINSQPVGSDTHTQAMRKLQEANAKLVQQLRLHKNSQQNKQNQQGQQAQQGQQGQQGQQPQGQQQQAQLQAQQQAQLQAQMQAQQMQAAQANAAAAGDQQQTPQRPGAPGQPQMPNPMNQPGAASGTYHLKAPDELPADIKAKVEKADLAPPVSIAPTGVKNWHMEASKRYGEALYVQRAAKAAIAQFDRLVQQAQAQNAEVPPEIIAKRADCHRQLNESDGFIHRLAGLQKAAGHQRTVYDDLGAAPQAPNANGAGQANSNTPAQQPKQPLQLQKPTPGSATSLQGPGSAPNSAGPTNQNFNNQRPAIGAPLAQNQSRPPSQPVGGGGGPNGEPPVPLSHQEAIAAASKNWSGQQQTPPQTSAPPASASPTDIDTKKQDRGMPINKSFVPTAPQPVAMPPSRPTLAGANNGPLGMMGQPAIQKPEPYLLQGPGDRVLDKKKLDELVKQVTGGGGTEGETLHSEVEESILQLADEFVENVVASACKLAKLRGSTTLEIRDIQLILERQYNIRIPGYATDEVRTVRKIQPAAGYLQKMNAVQAAKVMNGRTDI